VLYARAKAFAKNAFFIFCPISKLDNSDNDVLSLAVYCFKERAFLFLGQ